MLPSPRMLSRRHFLALSTAALAAPRAKAQTARIDVAAIEHDRILTEAQKNNQTIPNQTAAFLLTKAVVPDMMSRGFGRLLYLTAEPSRHPRNGMINLGVPKAAMNQFARYIALELAPHGITANLVAPATVQGTSMNQKLTPEQLSALGAAAPMGRLVTPDEVAKTLAFLASEDSGFTTGHYFPLDGGLTMD